MGRAIIRPRPNGAIDVEWEAALDVENHHGDDSNLGVCKTVWPDRPDLVYYFDKSQ